MSVVTSNSVRCARMRRPAPSAPKMRRAWAIMIAAGLASNGALAAPQDPDVVAGSATVHTGKDSSTGGPLTYIDQTSPRAVINWRSFSIDAPERVHFNHQDVTSSTLNRVTGDQVSKILGTLTAKGQVILLNPNGILFGQGSRLDVGSFVASTAQLSNGNFMAGGRLEFLAPSTAGGSIVNQGTISVRDGGLVALVAPHVRNDGLIWARLGRVALGSGSSFTLDLNGDGILNIAVREADLDQLVDVEGRRVSARIEHGGATVADGGKMVMVSAATAKDLVDHAINLGGFVRADTVGRDERGQIVLMAAGGKVRVGGELLARGTEETQHGGAIGISADTIDLGGALAPASGQEDRLARIDASAPGGSGSLSLQYGDKGTSFESGNARAIGATLQNGTNVAIGSTGEVRVQSRIDGRPGGDEEQGKSGGGLEISGGRVVIADDIYTRDGAIRLESRTGDVRMVKPSEGELAPGRDTPVLFADTADIELSAHKDVVAYHMVTRGNVRVTSNDGNVELQARLGRDFEGAYPLKSLTIRALGTPSDDTKVKEVGNVNALRDVVVAPGGKIDIQATRNIRLLEGPDNGKSDSARLGIVSARKGESGRGLIMRSERLGDSGRVDDPSRLGDLANDPYYWKGINSRISHIGPDKNSARADGRWTDLSKTTKDTDNPSLIPPSPVKVLAEGRILATILPGPENGPVAPAPIASPDYPLSQNLPPASTISARADNVASVDVPLVSLSPATPGTLSEVALWSANFPGTEVAFGDYAEGYSGGRGVAKLADFGLDRSPAAPRDVFAEQRHVVEVKDCAAPVAAGNGYFGTGAFGQPLSVGCH